MTGGAQVGTGGHLFERGENGQNGLGVMWERVVPILNPSLGMSRVF